MNKIKPGEPIRDNNGKLVQAHAGQIIYENGVFYWYGEDKSNMVVDKVGEPYHNGVHAYSSTDLYNWRDEGIILRAENNIESPLDFRRIVDRPHILFNEKTKKYVMWVKLAGGKDNLRDWKNQRAGIAVADTLLGPYEFVKDFCPNNHHMGDFDFVEDNGEMFIYFSNIVNNPSNVACMKLTDDYMDVKEGVSYHFDYDAPPNTRESPAFFKMNGEIYVTTSGCTGYHPNPSTISKIKTVGGEVCELGNVCIGDTTKSTFHSQISCVFRHPEKKNLYIALADRWLSDLDISKLPWITEGYRILQSKTPIKTDLTWQEVWKYSKRNISLATYVWLPFELDENGVPRLCWADEWKIEDYS